MIGDSTGWNGERWLDIRRGSVADSSLPSCGAASTSRRALGCDGVEPDQNNPVGNARGFPITLADQKAW